MIRYVLAGWMSLALVGAARGESASLDLIRNPQSAHPAYSSVQGDPKVTLADGESLLVIDAHSSTVINGPFQGRLSAARKKAQEAKGFLGRAATLAHQVRYGTATGVLRDPPSQAFPPVDIGADEAQLPAINISLRTGHSTQCFMPGRPIIFWRIDKTSSAYYTLSTAGSSGVTVGFSRGDVLSAWPETLGPPGSELYRLWGPGTALQTFTLAPVAVEPDRSMLESLIAAGCDDQALAWVAALMKDGLP